MPPDTDKKARRFSEASRQEQIGAPQIIQPNKATRHKEGGGLHKAYCKDNASTGSTIDCYLDTDTTGEEIEVNCILFATSDLQDCAPLLVDSQLILVEKIGAAWWCVWWFNNTIICSAPT